MPPIKPPNTVPELLARLVATEPGRPLITQYDDHTGERVELSAATLDNWVAKTANLLEEAGFDADASSAVLLPPHWQTAAVMVGCWTVGLALAHGPRGAAPSKADVVFAASDRFDEARAMGASQIYGLSLGPLGAPLAEVPAGIVDYAGEVRGQPDRYVPASPVDPTAPALVGQLGPNAESGSISHADLVERSLARATELDLTSTDRLLVDVSAGRPLRPLDWLLAPLAAGAGIVLCRNTDPARLERRIQDERVTRRL